MKLHFGSGGHNIPGFESHDMDLDIRKTPLPFENETIEACVASHVLEHVSGPEALNFLTECRRILVFNGWIRLVVPIVGEWLESIHARDLCLGHGHLCCYNEQLLRTMLWMAGFSPRAIRRVDRDDTYDHHHLTIGLEKDAVESCRLVATKTNP